MEIFLASRYSRFPEMQEAAELLKLDGHVITSRWHEGNHQIADEVQGEERQQEAERFAKEDAEDLFRAKTIVIFAEAPRTASRGGKHVEFGMALAWNLRIFVVGDKIARENVYYWLPNITYVRDVEELRSILNESRRISSVV